LLWANNSSNKSFAQVLHKTNALQTKENDSIPLSAEVPQFYIVTVVLPDETKSFKIAR